MELQGQKVRSINPGSIQKSLQGFKFTILVNGVPVLDKWEYLSATICKQKMREEVKRLRKKHMV